MSGVSFEGIRKVYDDGTVAVKGLDLKIKDGEFLVLVGPSGCGKTSLLRMIAGHEDITNGTVFLDNQNISNEPPAARSTSMMFQSYALFPHLKVIDNVAFALKIMGVGKTERHARAMELLESGLFDKAGFTRLHVAGHPEGNKDIDPDGTNLNVDAALQWKQKFSERSDAEMALATQFAFEAGPIIEWANAIKAAGVDIPIHIGIAGPAKLQTLIKFAIACGVGASLKVLQKRAMDVTKLLLPYEPTDVITQLAAHKAKNPDFNISHVHFFPLGGIKTNANWAIRNGGNSATPAANAS